MTAQISRRGFLGMASSTAAITLLGLAGCGSSSSSSSSSSSDSSSSSSDAGKALKIGIITSSGIDDGSFNENCYDGIQEFLKDHSDCSVNDIK